MLENSDVPEKRRSSSLHAAILPLTHNRVIGINRPQAAKTGKTRTFGRRRGEILPRFVGAAKVHRALEDPRSRLGRVCHRDPNVGEMKFLLQLQQSNIFVGLKKALTP